MDCGEGAVALCANLQSLVGVGPIRDDVLLAAVEHQLDGRMRLLREGCCDDAFVARAELRAETAAHVLSDDANIALGQLEDVGEFVANAGCALGRGVDGHLFGLPIDDETVRFKSGVRLHLGEILALYDYVGLGKALFDVTNIFRLRPVNIALLGNAFRSATTASAARFVSGPGVDHRSIVGARVCAIDDERHRVVLHLYQPGSIVCNLLRDGSNASNGLAGVADHRIPRRRLKLGIA